MPELPEVEVARQTLQRHLGGRRVARVVARRGRPVIGAVRSWQAALRGARLGRPRRHGKQLLIPLTDARGARRHLALHLGMTGRIVPSPAGASPPRFAHLQFVREDGLAVSLRDPRRFGRAELLDARQAREAFAGLGPDPLLDAWSSAVLARALRGTRRPVKAVLLDQARLAGLGNIQAAEALWVARIHPERPASECSRAELARLTGAISRTLERTLAQLRAALASDERRLRRGDPEAFTGPLYLTEGARNPFDVYGRAGQPCRRCRTTLENLAIAGRSTVLCPECQLR